MAAAQVKSQHYWRQLRTTLTAGQWDAAYPAKAPNGALLSWSELLRKFSKHCIGQADVVEIASQTQALSLILAANSSDRTLDGNDVGTTDPLALGDECLLAEERLKEGVLGLSALEQFESAHSDSMKVALAYYAFALRRPTDCLELLAQVRDLADAQGLVPPSAGTSLAAPATLQVPGASSHTSLASSWAGSFVSDGSSASITDINEGRAWAAVECIRSICLKGMSHETLSPDDPRKAFLAYLSASALVANASTEIPASALPASPFTQDGGSFTRYRELWRWTERLLRRGIIVGAKVCDVTRDEALWTLFQQYHACSAHWPPTFRPDKRTTIAVLHLHALILRARARPALKADRGPRRWITTARSIVQEMRAILTVSTQFPKAGEQNVKVEDLVDLAVAAWEADGAVGEYAGWVIDVLWWATRLTFNSYRIFRHMSRLFYVAGDAELAKRTLRVYVQIVSKAREASMAEAETARDEAVGAFGAGKEIDTDRNWVETLVHGARMLSRLALASTDGLKAADDAKEAGEMLTRAKTRLDQSDRSLVAAVQLAEAIWNIAMAYTEQDALTRTTRFDESLTLLLASLESNPTPSTHHHLALAYLRPGHSRDLQKATVHARAAVEGEPDEMRHWHLLGLLLTAAGDWSAAQGVLDIGIGIGDADLADDPTELQPSGGPTNGDLSDRITVQDFAAGAHPSSNEGSPAAAEAAQLGPESEPDPVFLLAKDAVNTPPSSTLLRPLGDRPNTSRPEVFEQALQIRMTQLTVAEYAEGPEGAEDKWVEVFQWYSERRESTLDDRRRSIDSRRVSQEMLVPDASAAEKAPATANDTATSSLLPPPEPETEQHATPNATITVTPATPSVQSPAFSQDQVNSVAELPTIKENGIDKRFSLEDGHRNGPKATGKKVREVFISGVHKSRARVTTISKKIGHNVVRHNSLQMKRSRSAPDLNVLLGQAPFQASSIHLRHHLSIYASQQDLSLLEAPPPPLLPPPSPTPPTTRQKQNARTAKDRRSLSTLWLMSSATFRRLGKIEQAKGAIQEAEVRDEHNPAVWVQLGLYYMALDENRRALEAFQKALFIAPDDVSATIHLCRLYFAAASADTQVAAIKSQQRWQGMEASARDNVNLAVGLLSELTKGAGWDVPEAWYFLGKLFGLQGRKDRERECLCFALTLAENRPLRDVGVAVGWCL